MKILGIETSCDDTCVSLIEIEKKKPLCFKVISNIVSSQTKIHEKWGGVHPSLAKREHQLNLPLVLKRALKKDSLVDAIAVTVGPGLDPALWVGINFAKDLAQNWKKPLIPVNHIEAHLIVSLFSLKKDFLSIKQEKILPAIGLIVSGGHTQIVLMKKIGQYQLLGETRDDAAGECFDKTARILGLGYPGGPALSAVAQKFKENSKFKIILPRPMINNKSYDLSFSGLKTAVLYRHQSFSAKEKSSKEYLPAMAHEIQQSIIDVLFKKTMKAIKENKVNSLIVGGGVSANKELRKRFQETGFLVLFPPTKTETDNALMIAVAGSFKKLKPLDQIKAESNLKLPIQKNGQQKRNS
jgi:N6-L-threonylcarbamoyladenine synthase